MKFLLISNVDESQLFILNALTNSLFSFFKKNPPSISLILISSNKVDDNFLFIENKYLKVEYIKNLCQINRIEKKDYDYLISIENSLVSIALSYKTNAKSKVSFKGRFTSLVFDKIVQKKNTAGHKHLRLEDLTNLMELTFSCSEFITPKYHLENHLVRKNHKMIHWIYSTNHSIDLLNTNYILLDIKIYNFQKSLQLEMVSNLCGHLIDKFKLKIIFITDELDRFKHIINSSEKLTRENFINSQQSINNAIAHFPIFNHSSIIVTNKSKITSFLDLINKPYYLIKHKRKVLKLFSPVTYYKNLSKKTIGEISYMLKCM